MALSNEKGSSNGGPKCSPADNEFKFVRRVHRFVSVLQNGPVGKASMSWHEYVKRIKFREWRTAIPLFQQWFLAESVFEKD